MGRGRTCRGTAWVIMHLSPPGIYPLPPSRLCTRVKGVLLWRGALSSVWAMVWGWFWRGCWCLSFTLLLSISSPGPQVSHLICARFGLLICKMWAVMEPPCLGCSKDSMSLGSGGPYVAQDVGYFCSLFPEVGSWASPCPTLHAILKSV